MILRLNDNEILNGAHIAIADIKPTEALTCYSELLSYNNSLQPGDWYLNTLMMTTDSGGWKVDKETISGRQLVKLRKISDSAMEGDFICNIERDINPSASVKIYHPSELNQDL